VFDSSLPVEGDQAGRNMIMEPLIATAAEATDMLRVGRSRMYGLIAARRRDSMRIGRPQRASAASIRHVAGHGAALNVKTQRPGESPTSEHSEEVGDVLAA
jgi:hypothetical protein